MCQLPPLAASQCGHRQARPDRPIILNHRSRSFSRRGCRVEADQAAPTEARAGAHTLQGRGEPTMERGAAQPGSRATGKLGYDVADRGDLHKLHTKAVGLVGVLFLTVTGAAPISAMLFNVPIAVGYGNGIGAPASFLVATVILLIFSVGYAAMASKVTAVGGFYSFISHGLGREAGLAMGFGSVVAYCVFEASLAGGFAY